MYKLKNSFATKGSINCIVEQLVYNKIDAFAYEYLPGFVVFKLNDHSNIIQEFIYKELVPAGVKVLYDIHSTYTIYGACFAKASFFQNIKYRIWIGLYKWRLLK